MGISSVKPLYVVSINYKNGDIVVGDEIDLYSTKLYANDLNWSIDPKTINNKKLKAKIRYRSSESSVRINLLNKRVCVEFDKPQRAITPGQAIVFYDENKVVGGGWIEEVSKEN